MPHVDRFSVSLDTELLAAFDHYIAERGYVNRSEAVRDLIRDLLLASNISKGDGEVAAFLTFACDWASPETMKRLRALLWTHRDGVVGSMHVPLEKNLDGIALGLKGRSDHVQEIADKIHVMRGVMHSRLVVLGPRAESKSRQRPDD